MTDKETVERVKRDFHKGASDINLFVGLDDGKQVLISLSPIVQEKIWSVFLAIPGVAIISDDQSLPLSLWSHSYLDQQCMLKDGFKKVIDTKSIIGGENGIKESVVSDSPPDGRC